MKMNFRKISFAVMAAVLTPSVGWACACGCGVFDVGTSSMLPQGPGGMVFAEYDFMDQNMNWSGASPRPRRTMATRRFGPTSPPSVCSTCSTAVGALQVELPYDVRYFAHYRRRQRQWHRLHHLERLRRSPTRRHLYRVFPGHVRRRDLRTETADGQ